VCCLFGNDSQFAGALKLGSLPLLLGEPHVTALCKVIACATIIEEMLPLLPEDVTYEVLDFGLHLTPEKLRNQLQATINAAGSKVDAIILGYGLCSMAVVGLKATGCTLVVPRVDDCIAIFLGSRAAYQKQFGQEPGTYYLTKGWIEVSDTPFAEYERLVEKYGLEQAERMIKLMLKNYTRLAFIEESPGSKALVKKMLYGPWDDDFVIARPGETICYADFQACSASAGKETIPIELNSQPNSANSE
jgi:hypothetical protein